MSEGMADADCNSAGAWSATCQCNTGNELNNYNRARHLFADCCFGRNSVAVNANVATRKLMCATLVCKAGWSSDVQFASRRGVGKMHKQCV